MQNLIKDEMTKMEGEASHQLKLLRGKGLSDGGLMRGREPIEEANFVHNRIVCGEEVCREGILGRPLRKIAPNKG